MPASPYLPVLALRPAEMMALQELPEKDKDALVPLFRHGCWGASHTLEKSIGRLKKAFGTRACFLELADEEYVEKRRTVHDELDELRDSLGGYENWYQYLRLPEHQQFIPVLQMGGTPAEFSQQITKLYSLGRGLLVRLEKPEQDDVVAATAVISQRVPGAAGITFLLDFCKQNANFASMENSIRGYFDFIKTQCPDAQIAMSASSFPDGFSSIVQQPIYERVVYERLRRFCLGLIYSDRGSARAEKQSGGGGLPAPRIDYPKKDGWFFFRQAVPLSNPFLGYQRQAINLIASPVWEQGLKLWGRQMVEKTAAGDSTGGISSPNRSTAARINLHLHRQLYYDDDVSFFDTDEEWTD